MDPSHVVLWICGWTYQYLGLPDFVEDYVGYWEGDGVELVEIQVVIE